MRQIIFDTETTGLDVSLGHRVIEIGCIEIVNRRISGRRFQTYLNPERDIEQGALAVHGLSRAQLESQPRFVDVAADLFAFLGDAELVIHNAPFDVGFMNAEIARLPQALPPLDTARRIVDTLAIARTLHPGQRNSLDALCKRYNVDNSRRELHGALLDAQLLAEVFLVMTGGQSALALDEVASAMARAAGAAPATAGRQASAHPSVDLRVVAASTEELAAHQQMLRLIARSAGGECLFEPDSRS